MEEKINKLFKKHLRINNISRIRAHRVIHVI